jgi:hypothetical protein
MHAEIIVTRSAADALVIGPGNPHLIWDGTEPRVITEAFYRALSHESGWLLIMTRDDLTEMDPDAITYHPVRLAGLLTTFAADLASERCPRTVG